MHGRCPKTCHRLDAKEDGLSACLPYLTNVQHGYFYGRCAVEFAQAVTGKLPNSVHQTLEEAVEAATLSAGQSPQEDQVILLSPAAASFDQFTSFEARGETFCRAAEQQISNLAAYKAADEGTAGHV